MKTFAQLTYLHSKLAGALYLIATVVVMCAGLSWAGGPGGPFFVMAMLLLIVLPMSAEISDVHRRFANLALLFAVRILWQLILLCGLVLVALNDPFKILRIPLAALTLGHVLSGIGLAVSPFVIVSLIWRSMGGYATDVREFRTWASDAAIAIPRYLKPTVGWLVAVMYLASAAIVVVKFAAFLLPAIRRTLLR